MKTWFTLVQWRHVTVRAHYTWLLLLVLGTWSLARVALPPRLPDDAWLWTTAVVIMAAYIGCVVVHEAGHWLAVQLLRVPMPALNIHPIGTLARRGREQAGPHRTAAVAAAGPLSSLLLWLAVGALEVTPGTAQAAILSYTAWFSLTLALVNLLPGLPLDGGRLLRAALWAGGTFSSATRIATAAGYVVTAGVLLLGLRALGNPETMLRGFWFILLAWLIYTAGASLARRRTIGHLFERLRARDVLVPPPWVISPEATLHELVQVWRGDTGENYTPVVVDAKLVGLISRSQAYDVPQGYWRQRTVGSTMQPITDITTIQPTTPLSQVLPHVDTDLFHPAPLLVVEDGRLLGLIDSREIEPLLDVQDVFGIPPSTRTDPLPTSSAQGDRTQRAANNRLGRLSTRRPAHRRSRTVLLCGRTT